MIHKKKKTFGNMVYYQLKLYCLSNPNLEKVLTEPLFYYFHDFWFSGCIENTHL